MEYCIVYIIISLIFIIAFNTQKINPIKRNNMQFYNIVRYSIINIKITLIIIVVEYYIIIIIIVNMLTFKSIYSYIYIMVLFKLMYLIIVLEL